MTKMCETRQWIEKICFVMTVYLIVMYQTLNMEAIRSSEMMNGVCTSGYNNLDA
jgi:hypothetical protein